MSKVIISMDKKRNFRAYTILATEMIEKMRGFHHTTPVASAALGRLIICTSLMGLMLKGEDDKVTTIIKGMGPAGQLLATAKSNGDVKGYIENPMVNVPNKDKGKFDVGLAVGPGQMTVIKDMGLKEPYVGQIDLVSGEIAEDFTAYFAYSEQQPSSVMLGVLIDRDYSIKKAAGCIIQMLPDADEEIIDQLEQMIGKSSSITQVSEDINSSLELHDKLFSDFEMQIVGEREVDYKCDCSWERFEKAFISIGKEEIEKIYNEDGEAELLCHFCMKKYKFDKDRLKKLLDQI